MAIYETVIVGRRQVAEKTLEISIKRPSGFSFKAGQYIQIGVPKLDYPDVKGASRVLSISSSPLNQKIISVTFRDTGSGFKRTLRELPVGAPVSVDGPYGFLTLPKKPVRPLVFVAGGIGITPYLSMIRSVTERHSRLPITLLYANRSRESAPYFEELETLASRNKYFTLKNRFGIIDKNFIKQNVRDIHKCAWSIAGPPAMTNHVKNLLFLLGVRNDLVYCEEFVGY